MATPREILRRTAQKRPPVSVPQPALTPQPAPMRQAPSGFTAVPVAPAPMNTPAVPVDEPAQSVRMVVPQPIRTHSVYRQLMRSHDRMHTRHLEG